MDLLERILRILDRWRRDSLEGLNSYDTVVGSKKNIIYYTGLDAVKNPSGTTTNVHYVVYSREGCKTFTKEMYYNSEDCVTYQEVFKGDQSV